MMKSDFQWGISTLGCPTCNLTEATALADRFDFPFLELRALGGSIDLPAELLKPENERMMQQLAAQNRVRVFGSSFLISSRENDYDGFAALGHLADHFNVAYLRIFGGFDFSQEADREKHAIARENLQWIHSLNLKARPALETHDGYSSAQRCHDLQQALGEELPIIWDAHHTWRYAAESLAESWRLLASQVVDIHLKDSRRDETGKVSACVPGEGDVPVKDLLALLAREGYSGLVTFEYEKLWEPALPDLAIALDAFNRCWRS